MDLGTIILGVVSALGGGALGAFLSFRINNKKTDHDISKDFLDLMKGDNEKLRSEVDELKSELKNEIENNRLKMDGLMLRIDIMEGSHADLPIPHWIKDLAGRLLFVNHSCFQTFIKPFGVTKSACIGMTDEEIFGEQIGSEFNRRDLLAQRKKKPVFSIEDIEVLGVMEKWQVSRYPIMKNGAVVCMAGVSFPLNSNDYED